MYLSAERYVSGYSFQEEQERALYDRLVKEFGVEEHVDPDTPSAHVKFTVGYWRKANQIHTWFVENCQGGRDECQKTWVDREKLVELRELCLRVLASTTLIDDLVPLWTIYDAAHPQGAVQLEPGKVLADAASAHDLLPTAEGFFFGGTDYDEFYWRDLKITVENIDRALSLPGAWDFEYHSSW